MEVAQLLSNLVRFFGGRALSVSGLVHVGALFLLGQTWLATTVDVPQLAGSRQAAIQLDASFREAPQPSPVMVSALPVEVMPRVAHAFDRTFVDSPSADVDWSLDLSEPPLEAAADTLAAAALHRARDPDPPRASTATFEAFELPRARTITAPPQTATVVPSLVGTDPTSPPQYESIPPPRYPELARQRGWQGTVLLVVNIDATGRVTRVDVEESSGYQMLDAAAVNAVRRWRYKPAVGRYGPVATEELQPVTFRLPR